MGSVSHFKETDKSLDVVGREESAALASRFFDALNVFNNFEHSHISPYIPSRKRIPARFSTRLKPAFADVLTRKIPR